MTTATALREVVEPLVAAAGLELWDTEVGPGLVRVLVDRPGGVDLEALGELATAVSAALDAAGSAAPAGRYELQVSSPGVERPLRTPEQYRRYLSQTVAVKTIEAVEGERRFRARLAAVDDDGISVVPEGAATGTAIRLPFSNIQKANTVLVWGPA